jgi:DNA helicase-2/ATP-dependent DNA helicase PcrA
MAEERRLLYVGLTRAKQAIHLSHTSRRWNFGYDSKGIPSRFLKDLPEELLTGDMGKKESRSQTIWSHTDEIKSQSSPNVVQLPVEIQFSSGQKVSHDSFGSGIVIESKPLSGDEMVIVAFDDVGIKKLIAGSAKLKIEDIG